MRERCNHCKKWIKDGGIVTTLEGLVSDDIDINFAICEKCSEKTYESRYWDKWVKKQEETNCLPTSKPLAGLEPLAKLAVAPKKYKRLRTSTLTHRHSKSIATTSQSLQSTAISETITPVEELTSIQEDSLALERPSQESTTDFTTLNLISGTNTSESLTKDDQSLQLLKTPQGYSTANSISEWVKSCKTFPKSGTWENGQFYQQDTLDRPKLESGCLSLPTLLTGTGNGRNAGQTNCEKWLRDKGYRANTQALSVEGMCLIFGFPANWAKSICSNPKEGQEDTTLEDCLGAPLTSTAPLQLSNESSISIDVSQNNIDADLESLLEQRDRLIAQGTSPEGVWINCGKVHGKNFKQAVWKSTKPRSEWGEKKSQYIGEFGKEAHLSAIAQHKAGQELRKVEKQIKKLQST